MQYLKLPWQKTCIITRVANSRESPYNVDVQLACSLAWFSLLHLSDPARGRCGRVAQITCILVSFVMCVSASFKLTVISWNRVHPSGLCHCCPAWTDSFDFIWFHSMEDLNSPQLPVQQSFRFLSSIRHHWRQDLLQRKHKAVIQIWWWNLAIRNGVFTEALRYKSSKYKL